MRFSASLLLFFLCSTAMASNTKTMKFTFKNAEITDVIAAYAKISGRKFVIDPGARGKTTILAPREVPVEEAFALLSTALATNQIAIIEQDETLVVMPARNAQRSLVPVLTELPALKPERLVTMVFTLKNVPADEVNRRLRILPSKDGELTPFGNNKVIVTDWSSNVHRIARLLAELDQPGTTFTPPPTAK